jgi:Protein of unknown function (DUF1217)
MSFTPTIPMAGLAGWRFLERTEAAQRAAFEKGPQLAREIAYFKENIGKVASAEELVKDRRLLKVALGAFGLEAELDKKAFVRKVLEGGTDDPRSFANRMSEPAYRKLAEAFGFGNAGGPKVGKAGFADGVADQYRIRQFEVAVGNVDDSMRLALNFRREIAELANAAAPGDNGKGWLSVIGSRPLRTVFEKAFGLPREFVNLDIDRQREILRDRARSVLGDGSLAAFKDPEAVEKVIARFQVRMQIEAGPSAVSSPALTLLQNAGSSAGLLNLLLAR